MAEITTNDQTNSPTAPDDLENGNGALESRGVKRPRPSAADDDDDDDDKPGRERRKIEIKFIQDKSRRHITFSKRKAGIMKKVSHVHAVRRPARDALPTRLRVATLASRIALLPIVELVTRRETVLIAVHRHTSCPSSPAPRCYFWSCPRLVLCTPSPLPSFSRS